MKAQRYIITLVMSLLLSNNVVGANYELDHRATLSSPVKGIYISQATLEDRKYLEYLIARSKQVGINTFIIDLNRVSNKYEKNILLVKNAGIQYVARIVVFPFGSEMSRYRLVEAALTLGADDIQLDHIRELSKYPNRLSEDQLFEAVEDANADGWYAWSANNKYDRLFNLMANR